MRITTVSITVTPALSTSVALEGDRAPHPHLPQDSCPMPLTNEALSGKLLPALLLPLKPNSPDARQLTAVAIYLEPLLHLRKFRPIWGSSCCQSLEPCQECPDRLAFVPIKSPNRAHRLLLRAVLAAILPSRRRRRRLPQLLRRSSSSSTSLRASSSPRGRIRLPVPRISNCSSKLPPP